MSSRTPDKLRKELENMRNHLDSKQYGHGVTEHANTLAAELEEDYLQRDLEKLLASYKETFPEFYDEDPVSSAKEYLNRFEDIEDALEPLDSPE